MELVNAELLPGIIIDNNDPENLCRVKAIVPKYFDESMEIENLPWIHPLTFGGQNTPRIPEVKNKIWVLVNKHNCFEYWYFTYAEITNNSINVDRDINTSVMFSKNNGTSDTSIQYNDKDGIILNNGSNLLQIGIEGNPIVLKNSDNIGITTNTEGANGPSINIGNINEQGYSLVKTDVLKALLLNMSTIFGELAESSKFMFTIHLSKYFMQLQELLNKENENLGTTNTTAN